MTLSSGVFQPAGFERYVPVMAAEQRGELQFAVPYIGQYHDCSVVVVLVEHPSGGLLHAPCTLTIAGQTGTVAGGGTDQAKRYRFVVTPPIPDEQATRLAMTFHVDPRTPATFSRAAMPGSFQPDRFERYVPVGAMQQREDLLVTVPYLCQYDNCSVMVVLLEHPSGGLLCSDCHLTVADHEVRSLAGMGGRWEARFRFAVIPSIPDEQATRIPMTVQVDPGTPPKNILDRESFTPIAPTTVRFHSENLGG